MFRILNIVMGTPVPVVQSGRGDDMKEHEAWELINGLTEEQKVKLLRWLSSLQQSLSHVAVEKAAERSTLQ